MPYRLWNFSERISDKHELLGGIYKEFDDKLRDIDVELYYYIFEEEIRFMMEIYILQDIEVIEFKYKRYKKEELEKQLTKLIESWDPHFQNDVFDLEGPPASIRVKKCIKAIKSQRLRNIKAARN